MGMEEMSVKKEAWCRECDGACLAKTSTFSAPWASMAASSLSPTVPSSSGVNTVVATSVYTISCVL